MFYKYQNNDIKTDIFQQLKIIHPVPVPLGRLTLSVVSFVFLPPGIFISTCSGCLYTLQYLPHTQDIAESETRPLRENVINHVIILINNIID